MIEYATTLSIYESEANSIKDIPIKITPICMIGLLPYFWIILAMKGEDIITASEYTENIYPIKL